MKKKYLTQRDRLFKALNFEESDRPPHFELAFELEEEAFGLKGVTEEEWLETRSIKEREKLFARNSEIIIKTIETFRWDAVPVVNGSHEYDFYPFLRREIGYDIPIAGMIWGSAISMDSVKDYRQFAFDMCEDPQKIHKWACSMKEISIERAKRLVDGGCDLIIIPSDLAYNQGLFISADHYREFAFPYLKELIEFIHKNDLPVILHTDGDIMSILDDLYEIGIDALQSIDPLAGMDIAEIKKETYGKFAIMGNVDCGAIQSGPIEKIIDSAKYALEHGPVGGGYIFSSSNSIFKGVPLENYQAMVDFFHQKYPLPE